MPVFISYSRKDYYFAESLTFHLLQRGIPAWLDVKDLRPGEFWNRDLEAALDAASSVVLVVSPESLKSPNVRAEWERAKQRGKRIVLALFRRAKLPAELAGCEIVDFRGAFTPAVRRLLECLQAKPFARPGAYGFPFTLPPWIFIISLTLFIPLIGYFLLADWGTENVFEWILLPVAAVLLGWALFFSFLRRRMGMTHLLMCFAFAGAWTCYPLLLFAIKGQAALAGYAQPMVQAIVQNGPWMPMLSLLTLFGIGILVLIQPEDLLRWTPTGKAWGWFRARRTPRMPLLESSTALDSMGSFYLLYDPLDLPAAARFRRELSHPGNEESTSPLKQGTAVLLLTNRTRTQWLAQQAQQFQSTMLTIVGSRIALPAEVDWLWKREWIDFRHWDLSRLDRKSGLPRVPEAVSGTRFPVPVRVAHHLLCALLGLSTLLVGLPDPSFAASAADSSNFASQNVMALMAFVLWIWYIPRARGLLRRTLSEQAFYRFWRLCWALVCFEALWSCGQALAAGHVNPVRLLPLAAFLAAWPILLTRNRPKVAFWFPAVEQRGNAKGAADLGCKRDWQTLIWFCFYCAVWVIELGLSTNS